MNNQTVNKGDRFGRWTVISEETLIKSHKYVLCRCDCGNEKNVNLNSLLKGMSNSCGCWRREYISNKNYKHGHAVRNATKERLYNIWIGMRRRCLDEKDKGYHNYGERGITICPEWVDDYDTFRTWAYNNGYEDSLTIDRIDNDKGYSPNNCRWVNMQVQSNNTRFNHHITYHGETHTIAEWGRIFGISANIIGQRLKKGFPLEKVFFNGNLRYYKESEVLT